MPDKARLLALVAVTEGSSGTATKGSIEEYDQVKDGRTEGRKERRKEGRRKEGRRKEGRRNGRSVVLHSVLNAYPLINLFNLIIY